MATTSTSAEYALNVGESTGAQVAGSVPEADSFGGPAEDARFKEPPLRISGDADRCDHRVGNDDYSQAGNLYRLLPAPERERLHEALAKAMHAVPKEIIARQLKHLEKADPAYADGVRRALRRSA